MGSTREGRDVGTLAKKKPKNPAPGPCPGPSTDIYINEYNLLHITHGAAQNSLDDPTRPEDRAMSMADDSRSGFVSASRTGGHTIRTGAEHACRMARKYLLYLA